MTADRSAAIDQALARLAPPVVRTGVSQIRALSLWRPWPTLFFVEDEAVRKDVENRPWATHYRGPLVLHAGKFIDDSAWGVMTRAGIFPTTIEVGPPGYYGVVDVVGCCSLQEGLGSRGGWPPCDCGPWAFEGQCHIKVTNARAFPKVIPGGGRQKLWTPPDEVLDAVLALAA